MAAKQLREAHGSQATTQFPTRPPSRKQHWAPKLDRVPFPHSLPGRKVLVLSIAEGLALGLWGRLMLRHEFIILVGGVAVLPRAARAQLAIPVIGFLGSALQSVSTDVMRYPKIPPSLSKSHWDN